MIAAPTAEQSELARLVRRFLAARSPLSETRRFLDGGGYDRGTWDQMAKEIGLQALALPESVGGMGYGLSELVLVMEELGRVLYNGPFFSTVGMAATALLASEDEEQLAAWAPGIAGGDTVAALAYAEPGGPWDGAHTGTTWSGAYRLTGSKTLVVGGMSADLLLVTASEQGNPESQTLFAVEASTDGVQRAALPVLDQTRDLSAVELDGVVGTPVGRIGAGREILQATLQRAMVLLAAEQLGGAARCLDMAVDYARVRTQFGRAIGSFQAIKHRCADMLLDVETARSAVMLAVAEESAETASLARAHCSEVFSRAASSNLQVHGGIGFTWEHDAHLFLKRAKASEGLLGSPSEHRERLAALIGL